MTAKIKELLQRAEHRRRDFLLQNRRDAWRVINGPGDGAPAGLSVDKYGEYFVLNVRSGVSLQDRDDWSKTLSEFYSPAGVIQKTWAPKVMNSRSELVFGSFPSAPIIIQEANVKLLCELNTEMPTGLYLDLHEVRNWFYSKAIDTEVLNLFSYTCSFSTHAAAGGARRVTSVDAAKRALNIGRENMVLNNLLPDNHRWFADDVLTFLKRSRIREDKYDWIILDPPAFGRAGKKTFELRRDLDRLLEDTMALLGEEGRLLLSIHTSGFHAEELEVTLRRKANNQGKSLKVLKVFGLPQSDHPVLAASRGDRGDYLQVLVVEVNSA